MALSLGLASAAPARALAIPATAVIDGVSFSGADTGWVLTADTCGAAACSRVLVTGDRGRSFHRVTAPGGLPNGIRVATAHDGYVFGTGPGAYLQSSHDGGRSWHRARAAGAVLDLEVSKGRAYVLQATGHASVRVLSSPVGRDQFTVEQTATLPETSAPAVPVLATGGGMVYAATAGADKGSHGHGVIAARSGDGHWSRHALPAGCDGALGLALAAASPGQVSLLCSLASGADTQVKELWSSSDAGTTWTRLPNPPAGGFAVSLVPVGSGLAIAGTRLGIEVARDRRHWAYDYGDGLGGAVSVTALQFTDSAHGVAVARLADSSFAVVTSNNGGADWRVSTGLTQATA